MVFDMVVEIARQNSKLKINRRLIAGSTTAVNKFYLRLWFAPSLFIDENKEIKVNKG